MYTSDEPTPPIIVGFSTASARVVRGRHIHRSAIRRRRSPGILVAALMAIVTIGALTLTTRPVDAQLIPPGFTLTPPGIQLFVAPHFVTLAFGSGPLAPTGSQSITLTADTPNLATRQFDNIAVSVRLVGAASRAALYTEPNFGGMCMTITDEFPNLSLTPIGERTISSVRLGAACRAFDTSVDAPGVIVYEDVNWEGAFRYVTTDVADMSTGMIRFPGTSSLVLWKLKAVALYDGVGWNEFGVGRFCQTFLMNDNTLRDDLIGNDTTRSLRLNRTCAGPVSGEPAMVDLEVVHSLGALPTCPGGYEQRKTNLNEGTPSFIFLCIKYGNKGAKGSYISNLSAQKTISGTFKDTLCDGKDTTRLLGNLNEHISNNPDFVSFCVVRGTGPALKDVRFVVSTEVQRELSLKDLESRCRVMFTPGASVKVDDTNLNSGVVTTQGGILGNIDTQSPKAIQSCMGLGGDEVGVLAIAAPALTVAAGQPFAYDVRWTVPEGMTWRDLASVDLRLSEGEQTALWLRFDEASATISVVDAAGVFSPGAVPGSSTILAGDLAQVNMGGTAVEGSGPTGQEVTLRLWLTFHPEAAGHDFTASVSARGDDGRTQNIEQAAALHVVGADHP